MSEELSLVTELAIILIAAGVFTVISKALKQPLILGYIVAGFLVGPHLGLFPQFSAESVHQWSEIGIIFLLFNLGLEFSFKKLLKVGSSAILAAGTKCVGMFVVGIVAGKALGWTMMESVFFGGLLGMSSTTIIIKAYDDMGLKNRPYAGLIFGSLVVEDLIAVLLLVLLSTLAVSNSFAGGEMLLGLAKLAFFIVLWFLVGIFLIPTLLKKARKFFSDEILLIVSIGLCFLMVVLANLVGFSSALGAFVMGSILSETVEGENINRLTGNIKDLFGAIFFVSVGMMLDPAIIGQYWGTILVVTIVAMGGILLFSTVGVLLSGKGLDIAVHAGFSLAQLGEFAFIIAGLGCTLGVMRDFIYPVIIAVSVITTFTTPYMIKAADPVIVFLRRKLPAKVLALIDPPVETAQATSKAEQSEWKNLLKAYLLRLGLYGVLLIAVVLASDLYLEPLAERLFQTWNPTVRSLVVVAVTLLVMSPLLYGMSVTGGSINRPASKLLKEKRSNRWPILSLMLLRVMIAVGFVLVVISGHFELAGWAVLLVILAGAALLLIARFSTRRITRLESTFLSNYNEKDIEERRAAPVTSSVKEKLAAYDVHIEKVAVSPDFEFAGKTLREMPFRHTSGVNIVKIIRGSRSILIPGGNEQIFPGDELLAVGTEAQIEAFKQTFADASLAPSDTQEEFVVDHVTITEESYLFGKTLREVDMRASGCMVISVLRADSIITNPKPDFHFNQSDVVWLAGAKSAVEWYK